MGYEELIVMFVQLVSKIFNLCGPDPPTSHRDRQTDRRHAIARPRFDELAIDRGILKVAGNV